MGIRDDFGGGICQVSGIMYHLSLLAGIEIIERHNHTVDIYTDETRFCPLGLDSTLVYGYKDLRIKNNFSFPIRFRFEVSKNTFNLSLLSIYKIEFRDLIFSSLYNIDKVEVRIFSKGYGLLSISCYGLLKS